MVSVVELVGTALGWAVAVTMLVLGSLVLLVLTLGLTEIPLGKVEKDSQGRNMRKMGILSNIWADLHLNRASPVIQVYQVLLPTKLEDVVHLWKQVASKSPTLRSYPTKFKGEWYWAELKEDELDIPSQIHEVELQLTLEQESDDDLLCQAMVDLVNGMKRANADFPERGPQWDVLFVQMRGPNKHFSGIHARSHHALADGITLLESYRRIQLEVFPTKKHIQCQFINDCLQRKIKYDSQMCLEYASNHGNDVKENNKDSEKKQRLLLLQECDDHNKEREIGTTLLLNRSKKANQRRRHHKKKMNVWKGVCEGCSFLWDYVKLFVFEPSIPKCKLSLACDDPSSSSLSKNGDLLSHTFFSSTSNGLWIEEIRQICDHWGFTVTINDYLCCLFAHGLAEFLHRHSDDESYQQLQSIFGHNDMAMRYIAIFNTRALDSNGNGLERTVDEFKRGFGTNDLACIPIHLPLLCEDLLPFEQRLHRIKMVFDELKHGVIPMLSVMMIRVVFRIGGASLVNYLVKYWSSKCCGMVSNIVGPKECLAYGSESSAILRFFNTTNPTLFPIACGIKSYCERVHVTLSVDRNLMSQNECHEITTLINDKHRQLLTQCSSENGS